MSESPNKLIKFWQELKRRKTGKVIVAYAATAFIILQLTDILTPAFSLPDWTTKLVTFLLVIGFPIAVIFSWVFDITREGIKKTESIEVSESKKIVTKPAKKIFKASNIIISVLIIAVGILGYPKIFKRETLENLRAKGKISVAVMPFQNMTNDTTWNIWQGGIQESLISILANTGELKVRQKEIITSLLKTGGPDVYSSISPNVANTISQKLNSDIFIYGSIKQAGSKIRVDAQLIDTKTKEVLKALEITRPYKEDIIIDLTDSLGKKVIDFLLISKLLNDNPLYKHFDLLFNSPEAYRYFIYGESVKNKAIKKEDYSIAVDWYLKALAIDSNNIAPMISLSYVYGFEGMMEQSLKWVIKLYEKRAQWPLIDQLAVNYMYADKFKSPDEGIMYLRQIQQIDDQTPNISYLLGITYNKMNQYKKAIPELEKTVNIYHRWGIDDSYHYSELGNAYHKTGQYDKEKKLYKEAERYINDDQEIIGRRAILSFTEKDSMAGKRYIEKYISFCKKESISEADIKEGLGNIYFQAGILDKSEECYRKELVLEPENPGRMYTLANFFVDNNRKLNEVSELMDKAMELAKNKVDYYNYSDTKGWGLYKEGKYKEALEILKKSYNEAPFKLYSIRSHLEAAKKAVAGIKNN